MGWQEAVAQKNRETAGDRRRVFGKKANDQQHHSNLAKCARIYVDEFRKAPSSNNTQAAFREMQTALVLSERKLDQ